MMTSADLKAEVRLLSPINLLQFLKEAVQAENGRLKDVHATAIEAAARFLKEDHSSGNVFSMIERVLEPAGNRYAIDAIIAELQDRLKSPSVAEATPMHLSTQNKASAMVAAALGDIK